MFLDLDTMFEPLGGTAITATGPSTNTLDLTPLWATQNKRDVGTGEPLWLVVQTNAAFAGGTSIDFQLQTDVTSAFSTPTVLFDSGAVPLANLGAATRVACVAVPRGVKKYLRLYYTVVGTFTGGGSINAFLTHDVQDLPSNVYQAPYTVA